MTTNKTYDGNTIVGAIMTKPYVFFADRQTRPDYNMLDKLEHVFDELGLHESIKDGEKVMIKTHFGLYGNTNHIRPAYVRKLVDLVRAAGGFPFVADTASLAYGSGRPYGGRTTAPEYLMRAALNGFTQGTLGAPIIIADGYWGVDTYTTEINGEYIQKVPVAGALLDCDKVILLTHAKFHHMGIAASIKNMGVGMVGKEGKAAVHCPDGIQVYQEKCEGETCSACVTVCPSRCIEVSKTVTIDNARCVNCGHCASICSNKVGARAIIMQWSGKDMAFRVVENSLGVTKSIGPEKFYYINLAIDISDHCDCICVGAPLVMHDLGILGSNDPVAIDHATMHVMKGAAFNLESNVNKAEFESLALRSEAIFEHGRKIGLGTTEYELVTITREKVE
ncbi:MAG: DUF362 domain-containing protein [Candidatus Thorarchaeota archaeon]